MKHLYLLPFILFCTSVLYSQDSLRKIEYRKTADRMHAFMEQPGSSIEHMTVVYRQLKELSDVDEEGFALLTKKYNTYVFNERVIYIGEMTDLYEYERALVSLAILEQEYPENKEVKSLSSHTKSSVSMGLQRNLQESRTAFTIEPSLSVFSLGRTAEEYSFFASPGMGMMYGLGLYKTFGVYEKYNKGFNKKFNYSQVGIKVDYFHGKDSVGTEEFMLNYICPQLSLVLNRSIGIDLGYTAMLNTSLPTEKGFFTTNLSINFPIRFMSIGANARFMSDFDQVYHIQYGLSLKYMLKLGKKADQSEIDAINTSIEELNIK